MSVLVLHQAAKFEPIEEQLALCTDGHEFISKYPGMCVCCVDYSLLILNHFFSQ